MKLVSVGIWEDRYHDRDFKWPLEEVDMGTLSAWAGSGEGALGISKGLLEWTCPVLNPVG